MVNLASALNAYVYLSLGKLIIINILGNFHTQSGLQLILNGKAQVKDDQTMV